MEYKICKLQFSTGLHIGKGMLTDGEPIFMADTFFSALCHEALGISEGIEKLVNSYTGDIKPFVDRLQKVVDAGKGYDSFAGKSDKVTGDVKFIIKSEEIK